MATKKADASKAFPGLEDLPLSKVEYKLPEDEQEKKLRLHKERWSFYLSALLVAVFVVCCLVFLFNPQASAAEKDWARSAVASIMGVVFGYVFGKATK